MTAVLMTGSAVGEPPPSAAAAEEEQEMLPFERYALENGMTVILHRDTTLPLVTVNLWYDVGSKNERAGRSGFAHLFEHLMFMGTEAVPDFDVVMESGGSWNNATTSKDRTNYFEVGPSNQLETLLWLEADRFTTLGKAMTREKLDLQRDVVRNERRQSYENEPYGQVWLTLPKAIWPEGHPYHEPVIGSHEDLEAATVEDVVDFFDTFYTPANASLVVAGDFEVAEAKALIEKHFGGIPAGPAAAPVEAPEVEPLALTRRTLTDDVQLPKLVMAWRTPAFYAPGDAELDIASSILSEGKNSRLYKRMVYDEQLVDSVEAYQWSSKLGSIFVIEATAQPGQSLEKLESIIDAQLQALRDAPPEAREVERARNNIETSFVRNLQRLHNRANALNRYLFYTGDPGYLEADLQRYRGVTPSAIRGVIKSHLDPERRLIIHVLPEPGDAPEEDAAKEDAPKKEDP